jgi:hypothetical protein
MLFIQFRQPLQHLRPDSKIVFRQVPITAFDTASQRIRADLAYNVSGTP